MVASTIKLKSKLVATYKELRHSFKKKNCHYLEGLMRGFKSVGNKGKWPLFRAS